jgi:GxxExxY protein
MHENEISGEIVDAAYKMHRRIGPGLFESVYERILRYELEKRGLMVLVQHPVPVTYEAVQIDGAFRADLIVQHKVVVELKSVEKIAPVHQMQLLTYLRLSGLRLGLLINFNVPIIKNGNSVTWHQGYGHLACKVRAIVHRFPLG